MVACFLTSRQASGVWPARKFAQSVAQIEATGTFQTVLCGTTARQARSRSCDASLACTRSILAGRLDLLPLGCFLQKCAVVLCPDSGPRHLANAVRTPVVFVRNFAVGRIETGTYCETRSMRHQIFERVPPGEQERAFELLRPERVAEFVRQQIADKVNRQEEDASRRLISVEQLRR